MTDPEKTPVSGESDNDILDNPVAPSKELQLQPRHSSVASSSSTVASSSNCAQGPPADIEASNRQEPVDPEPYPPAVIVPRPKRRGLLSRFALIPEVENALHYKNNQKWTITFVVALCGVAGPFASGIIMPALTPITNDFHTSPFIANMSVSVYMLSMAIFPLWWSAFSEQFGRRSIYLISYAMFIVFSVLAAISNSIGMFIVMRMLNGGASAAVQAVGAGTIADIWEPRERGKAMGIFYLGPLMGPLLAPIIGGGLVTGLGWRSTMWCLTIYGGIILVFVIFALPETINRNFKPSNRAAYEAELSETGQTGLTRVSTSQSVKIKSKKYIKWLRMIFIDPLSILGYLRFPAVALTVYYASVTFGALYVLNISLEYTFSRAPYNFSTWLVGFVYFPGSFGYLVCSIFGGSWMDKIMRREALKAHRFDEDGRLIYLPEDRMQENAYLGAFLYPLALIWYGWAAEEHVMWVGVLLAPFFFGVGTMLIFAMVTTMLTEFMPRKSASAVALNNLFRNIFSFTGSLVAAPWIRAVGNGWMMTIVGIWALSSAAVILLMKWYGPRWRRSMDEALGKE